MPNVSDNANLLDGLEDRVDTIEALLRKLVAETDGVETIPAQASGCCALPQIPERPIGSGVSDLREGLIRYTQRKWVNGTTLRYYFFDKAPLKGHPSNVKLVRKAFQVWQDLGIGLQFEETKSIAEAELRIAFLQGDGSWSYVGTDNLSGPGQNEPTMNFGWDLRPEAPGLDTPLHEIGHAMGFPHEHQNPFSGIVWDVEAVHRYFSGPPNFWDEGAIEHNILRKLKSHEVTGSGWDPESVMHYAFEAGLIRRPSKYSTGLRPSGGLSETDKSEALKFYPSQSDVTLRSLKPMAVDILNVPPTGQVDYLLQPDETRDYTLRTIGAVDTLLVLFRKDGKRSVYMAGSDDSGFDRNAEIITRLEEGQDYILRARVLSKYGTDEAAVLYW